MAQSILGFNNLDEFFAFHAAPALAGCRHKTCQPVQLPCQFNAAGR